MFQFIHLKDFLFLKVECYLTLLFSPLMSKNLNRLSTFQNLPASKTMLPATSGYERHSHFDCVGWPTTFPPMSPYPDVTLDGR